MAVIDIHSYLGAPPESVRTGTLKELSGIWRLAKINGALVASGRGASGDFRRGNAQVAKLLATQKAMLGCVVVNINYAEQSVKEMHSYLGDDNFAAILLTSGVRGRHVTLAEAEDLNHYRLLTSPRLPAQAEVVIHRETSRRVERDTRVLGAPEPRQLELHDLVVLLRMGGEDWRMASVVAERTLNLYLEVSGSFSPDKIQFAVERIGSHRIVYGSGLPYVDPAATIGLVQDAEISESDKRNIFENSARRLFGWARARQSSGSA